jgi:hypothetical protein
MLKLTRGLLPILIALIPARIETRVVHLLSSSECPTDIRALRVGEEPIEAQKPFQAPEDWLAYLSWEIANTSRKSVAYVEIDLDFHGIAREGDRIYTYRYGQEGKQGDLDQAKLLKPREGTRLSISDEEYSRIKRFVEARGATSLSVVEDEGIESDL